MAQKKKKKIIRLPRRIDINIGIIIFAFILVYMGVMLVRYFTTDTVRSYEVTDAVIKDETSYTGFILRSETTSTAGSAGYINYYTRQKERAAKGGLIYSIDENGEATKLLTQSLTDKNYLTSDELSALRKKLQSFIASYDPMSFDSVYQLSYDLKSDLLSMVNSTTLSELNAILAQKNAYFNLYYADKAGVIVYDCDNYDGYTRADIDTSCFDTANIEKTIVEAGNKVEAGTVIYKTIDSEDWEIVIQVNDEDAAYLTEHSSPSISVNGTSLGRAKAELYNGTDGKRYAALTLSKYMIDYASDRLVTVTINKGSVSGLKIPQTAVVTKTFYVIPKAYMTTGNNSSGYGFNKEDLNSSAGAQFIECDVIYSKDDDYCYAGTDVLSDGDYLIMPDTGERYQVHQTTVFQGVLNINKGYAVFKRISILTETGDYLIIDDSLSFSISKYDHIALDGTSIKEGEFLFD